MTKGLFVLNEYYPNGNLKRHGTIKNLDARKLIFEGVYKSYHTNGTIRSEFTYSNSKILDTTYHYHENGVLESKTVHDKPSVSGENSRLVYYSDSSGNIQVKNGNGYARTRMNKVDAAWGEYTDGRKVGRWEGTFQNAKYRYEEWYSEGKITHGISYDSLNNEYPYQAIHACPQYPGGIHTLRKFIAHRYRYPQRALREKVNGDLIISFTIGPSGKATDFEVVDDLGFGTAEAGIKVLKKSATWIPGYERGVPISVRYTLPLTLMVP